MNVKMQIDFDAGKFLIRCPMWANDLVRNLPDRRWSKAKKAWVAPLLRLNAKHIGDLIGMAGVEATPAAKQALTNYRETVAKRKVESGGFPAWYKFKREPRKWQREALNKKWGKTAFALHADRRTGKCLVSINYACALRMEGKIDAVLIAVKLSGRRTWLEQFEIDASIPYDIYLPYTDDPKGFDQWLNRKHDFKVMVIGIESLSEGKMIEFARRFVMTHGKVYMAIDEAHLIAGHKSIRTERCIELGKQCAYRDTMTGTPLRKSPLDLFSQFEFLDPEIFGIGDYYAFRNQYAVVLEQKTKTGQKYPMIVGYKNIEELSKTAAPYVYEITKREAFKDHPEQIFEKAHVQMTAAQAKLYDQIKREKAYEFKGKELVVQNVLELMLRLHQVAGGFVPTYTETPYLGRGNIEKLRKVATWHPIMPWKNNPKIAEIIDLASDDCQFIIWAAYRAEIAAIVEALGHTYPKERVREVHGGISEADRAEFRHEFQAGKVKYIVGNTATGGSADSWSACETMIYYNNTQNMIDREQSMDRPILDGLDHSVLYVDIIMEKTVDDTIMRSIQAKVDLSEYVRNNIRDVGALLDGRQPSSAA